MSNEIHPIFVVNFSSHSRHNHSRKLHWNSRGCNIKIIKKVIYLLHVFDAIVMESASTATIYNRPNFFAESTNICIGCVRKAVIEKS